MLIGICGDIEEEKKKISQYIIRYADFLQEDKMCFYMPEDVLDDIEEHRFDCDILLVKIECKAEGVDGIGIAELVEQEYPKSQIIFYSEMDKQEPRIYDVEHCYCFPYETIQQYIQTAFSKARKLRDDATQQNILELICDRHKVYIQQKDIWYIKKEQRMTSVFTNLREYQCYVSLADLEKQTQNSLVRCHTGYIVNLDYVMYLTKNDVELKNGEKLPVGRTYYDIVKKAYEQMWEHNLRDSYTRKDAISAKSEE